MGLIVPDEAVRNFASSASRSGLNEAADLEGKLIIEEGGPLNGIRALFADEVFVTTLTDDYADEELERLTAAFAEYQPALNRFAQAAVGRYLRELPEGVVEFEGAVEDAET
jgi:hypothetical protein